MESASGLPEHALLSLLRKRHASGEPYAWLDHDCLLSVNPGRPLPSLYGRSRVAAAAAAPSTSDDAPHIFALAESAARRAARGEVAYIVVAGESGAGKTEAAKLLLLHLLHRVEHGDDDAELTELRSRLVLCRAALEPFTHASGAANANASRAVVATRVWLEPARPPAKRAAAAAAAAAAARCTRRASRRRSSSSAGWRARGAARRRRPSALHAAAASAAEGNAWVSELAGVRPDELRLLHAERAVPNRRRGAAPRPAGSQQRLPCAEDQPGALPWFLGADGGGGVARALYEVGMEEERVEALRKLLLGLLLTAQLPVPLLGAAGKVRLAHSGAAGGSADAEARREAAEKMEAKCEELLGLQPDAIAQLLLLEPPTDGRPAGWRPLDEAMRARDACVALGYAAVVSEIVEFMNAMLDEAAPLSAMAHATPPYDHPRLGGPYEGTVCLIDTPGVEASAALGRARGIDALCAAYTSERLRAELLRALAPPPMLKRDRCLAAALWPAAPPPPRDRAPAKRVGRAPAPPPARGGPTRTTAVPLGAARCLRRSRGRRRRRRPRTDWRSSRARRRTRGSTLAPPPPPPPMRKCTARSRPTSATISPRRDARASHPAAGRASAAPPPPRLRRRRRRPPSR